MEIDRSSQHNQVLTSCKRRRAGCREGSARIAVDVRELLVAEVIEQARDLLFVFLWPPSLRHHFLGVEIQDVGDGNFSGITDVFFLRDRGGVLFVEVGFKFFVSSDKVIRAALSALLVFSV